MKKLIFTLLVIGMLCTITGCKLASNEKLSYQEDRLIGLFISTQTLPERVDGVRVDDHFEFNTIEGVYMFNHFYPNMQEAELIDNQKSSQVEMHLNAYYGVDKEGYYREAKLYFNVLNEHVVFFVNEVFEDWQGNVYITQGSGVGHDLGLYFVDKEIADIFIQNDFDLVRNNKSIKLDSSFHVEIFGKIEPKYYIVSQMDKNDQPITTVEIDPLNPIEQIKKETDMEWILVKSYAYNQNEVIVGYEILSKEDKFITIYQVDSLGFFTPVDILLN